MKERLKYKSGTLLKKIGEFKSETQKISGIRLQRTDRPIL